VRRQPLISGSDLDDDAGTLIADAYFPALCGKRFPDAGHLSWIKFSRQANGDSGRFVCFSRS
jgi:hypothetical protein